MADAESAQKSPLELGVEPRVAAQPSLPYRVTAEKFDTALRTLRQSPSQDALNLAIGVADRPFVVRALVLLKLVTPGTLELTPEGRRAAYAEGPDRRIAILRAMLGYEPYRIVLMEAGRRKTTTLSAQEIAAIWGQNNIGSNDDNRTAAATAFAAMIEAANAGKYVLGRRGSPSRLDLPAGLSEMLTIALATEGDLERTGRDPSARGDPPDPGGAIVDPPDGFIRHQFPLRSDLVLRLELPRDLTPRDVDRLYRWLKTLPFDAEEKIEMS